MDCGRIKRLPVKKTKITEPVEARCVLLVLCLPPLCILCSLTWSEKRVLWMGTNKNLACLIRSASVFLFNLQRHASSAQTVSCLDWGRVVGFIH